MTSSLITHSSSLITHLSSLSPPQSSSLITHSEVFSPQYSSRLSQPLPLTRHPGQNHSTLSLRYTHRIIILWLNLITHPLHPITLPTLIPYPLFLIPRTLIPQLLNSSTPQLLNSSTPQPLNPSSPPHPCFQKVYCIIDFCELVLSIAAKFSTYVKVTKIVFAKIFGI